MTAAPRADPADEALLAALCTSNHLLAQRGVVRRYPKNKVLITEGSTGEGLFVLLAGSVKAYSMDEYGREITYSTVNAGDYFGEMSLDGGPRSASVMTLEPCICSVLSSDDVRAHLAQHPNFAFSLVEQIIRRARAATDIARNMALLSVYGRVVALLEGLHGPASEGAGVTLHPITHQDIANRVGSSREMVSRLLKDMEKGGYIELGVKRITLLKKLPPRW
ncbi:Crp/Fnr family transcriptional regulator [Polaromonas sp. C04]|uniref:Crp/Fnr family transcriptional regulator n=1 Tax=Polaromonas sp. C04 TaxID=1945857 RepID=UPI000984A35E|nr:Crp/Fnr family transcriptional regulator [Polaromonas sp. C04]OOG49942.1 Crp/Fnr family transcriptional regulator [Polaromonas sp. C04]